MKKWKDPLIEAEERAEREKQHAEQRGGAERDHYDRPSWREIDQRKSGGSGAGAGGAPRGERDSGSGMASLSLVTKRSTGAQKSYRAMLDKAFQGGNLGAMIGKDRLAPLHPGDDVRAKARQVLLDAIGGDVASKALRAWVDAGHALPDDDLDFLCAAAQADDETLLPPVFETIVALVQRRPVKRVAALRQRARFLADQARRDDLRALAAKLVDVLPPA